MLSSRSLQPLRSVSLSLGALPAACAGAQIASRRYAGTIANFKIPTINNEPNVSLYHKIYDALGALKKRGAVEVPLVVGGEYVSSTREIPVDRSLIDEDM
jgi:1-pyrroline-5-carboxylate dehydrogenase